MLSVRPPPGGQWVSPARRVRSRPVRPHTDGRRESVSSHRTSVHAPTKSKRRETPWPTEHGRTGTDRPTQTNEGRPDNAKRGGDRRAATHDAWPQRRNAAAARQHVWVWLVVGAVVFFSCVLLHSLKSLLHSKAHRSLALGKRRTRPTTRALGEARLSSCERRKRQALSRTLSSRWLPRRAGPNCRGHAPLSCRGEPHAAHTSA